MPVRPSSVVTCVRIALHAVERSCAVHTGTGRGTETGKVATEAILVMCGYSITWASCCASFEASLREAPQDKGRYNAIHQLSSS